MVVFDQVDSSVAFPTQAASFPVSSHFPETKSSVGVVLPSVQRPYFLYMTAAFSAPTLSTSLNSLSFPCQTLHLSYLSALAYPQGPPQVCLSGSSANRKLARPTCPDAFWTLCVATELIAYLLVKRNLPCLGQAPLILVFSS